MTEKLKPCPFCGGVPSIIDWATPLLYTHDTALCVYCPSCELVFGFDEYGGKFETEQEAAEAWNKRSLTPAQEHAEELYIGLFTMLDVASDIFEAMTPLFYDLQGSLKDEPQRWQKLIEKIEAQEAQP